MTTPPPVALRVVLTGGGTGGHVYPAIAVARRLQELEPGVDLLFVGTADRMEAKAVPAAGFRLETISIHGFATGSLLRRLRSLCEFAVGIPLIQSLRILRRFRPHAVVGTGGYVCAPVLLAARLLRIPSVTVEENAVPGLTTRWLAGLVTVSGTISEEASRRFAASRPGIMRLLTPRLRCEVLGTPVRPEVLSTSREEGLRALGLRADKLTILITGGSIGAPAINAAWAEAMPALAADEGFASRVQVLHLTGRGKSAATPVAGLDYHPRPYLDEMHWAYAAADIVVSRGGGSALAEITARGIPAIVVPWAGAAGNHQFYNAQPLQERGAAILISDAELSAETLTEALRELVRDDAKRAAMAQASKALGIPDAADRVVAVVRRLARR